MKIISNLKRALSIATTSNKPLKLKDHNSPRLLKINNQLGEINIYTIKNIKQKMDALIFKDKFNNYIGFRIINSKGFNSFGLKEEVDLVFCNRNRQVIETYSKFKINKFTQYHPDACEVYVFAKNMIKYLNITVRDEIKLTK